MSVNNSWYMLEASKAQHPDHASGFALVEMAFVLMFFVFFAWLAFSVQAMLYRAGMVSHLAFSAGRRVAVASHGTPTMACDYVERDYRMLRLSGTPRVSTRAGGRNPRCRTVDITDHYSMDLPTGPSRGLLPGIETHRYAVPVAPVRTAGTAYRATHTDNDL
jgi:hypothetical protein